MTSRSLDAWLQWQLSVHPKSIAMGLERVSQVGQNLGLDQIAANVVTVAGTNGKGSTVACYETWLRNAGYEVASFTSPHLQVYNERIKHNLKLVDDVSLCRAFAAIDEARAEIALTYFEFGTLAALYLIQQWQPDFAILEVGLGGRLDAVNIIDADLAHITPIGIDHEDWLGSNREDIGFEKAGILRHHSAAIINDIDPPQSVLSEVERKRCLNLRLGQDYFIEPAASGWNWRGQGREICLDSVLPGVHQSANLAGVVAGLLKLGLLDDLSVEQIRSNFLGVQLKGRFETVPAPFGGRLIVDVGHNHDAASALALNLRALLPVEGKIVVLLGMLEDKRADLFVEALKAQVDSWWLLGLEVERGQTAEQLKSKIEPMVKVEMCFNRVEDALDQALSSLGFKDIMLVAGSFATAELVLSALPQPGD